jgi:hypothetical protein
VEGQAEVHNDRLVDESGSATSVDVTLLFSLHENAITKEPGLSYPERWQRVSRLDASLVAQTSASLPRM